MREQIFIGVSKVLFSVKYSKIEVIEVILIKHLRLGLL